MTSKFGSCIHGIGLIFTCDECPNGGKAYIPINTEPLEPSFSAGNFELDHSTDELEARIDELETRQRAVIRHLTDISRTIAYGWICDEIRFAIDLMMDKKDEGESK